MKAKVKATGEIIDIAYAYKTVGTNPISKCGTFEGEKYNEDDLDFNIEDSNTPNYWTRLEHQYAGMAMQGLLQSPHLNIMQEEPLIGMASSIAHALVQKLKEKEERK